MANLILASTSAWRREMLHHAGISVECAASGVDERALAPHGDRAAHPAGVALRLAEAKADAVAARWPGRWVLGADQVASDGEALFGKPDDPDDHLRRLRALRGRTHTLTTAWALWSPAGARRSGFEETSLRMRHDVDDDELRAYVASGEGSGCAGGYAIERRGAFLFDRIDGDWFNIVGLPLFAVMGALRAEGWRHGPDGFGPGRPNE